jgi:hypothetical protein
MIDRIVSFALAQRFIIVVTMVGLAIWGIISFQNLPIDAYPDLSPPRVQIVTQWPGHAAEEVERFLDEHDDPDVFDLTRENMAQIVDTPKRRAFMRQLGERGWLGLTWPKELGGAESEGVYEFLLNEALAGRGGPQIGKGVGIIGKTLIAHGSDFLKGKFLPMILENDVEFAVGYSEPNAGSDAASMRLKAERTERDGKPGWVLNGQKTWTTSAHFAEWYWLGTRTNPGAANYCN